MDSLDGKFCETDDRIEVGQVYFEDFKGPWPDQPDALSDLLDAF
jgi:hypothetical protein